MRGAFLCFVLTFIQQRVESTSFILPLVERVDVNAEAIGKIRGRSGSLSCSTPQMLQPKVSLSLSWTQCSARAYQQKSILMPRQSNKDTMDESATDDLSLNVQDSGTPCIADSSETCVTAALHSGTIDIGTLQTRKASDASRASVNSWSSGSIWQNLLQKIQDTDDYKENSRSYRRTVFTNSDWVQFRSSGRVFENISTMLTSGIIRGLWLEIGMPPQLVGRAPGPGNF